jgi:hypothetical protein
MFTVSAIFKGQIFCIYVGDFDLIQLYQAADVPYISLHGNVSKPCKIEVITSILKDPKRKVFFPP